MTYEKTENSYNYIDVCHNSEIIHQEKNNTKTILILIYCIY